MTDYRKGGIALIVSAAGGILVMGLHPTGRELFAPGNFAPAALLVLLVHALAIVLMPVAFLGALALSKRLAAPDRLALIALVVYGFALAAEMVAAAASGLVAPRLAREILDAAPPESASWRIAFNYNGLVNQAFALLYAVGSSLAITLWSAAIAKSGVFARGIGIYGLVVGPAIVLAVLSGHLRLHVHGFGLIVLAQALWFILLGALLWRIQESEPGTTPLDSPPNPA